MYNRSISILNNWLHDYSAPSNCLCEFFRYCLTKEGEKTARDCISRSGLDDPAGPLLTSAHSASSSANQVQTNVRPTLFKHCFCFHANNVKITIQIISHSLIHANNVNVNFNLLAKMDAKPLMWRILFLHAR